MHKEFFDLIKKDHEEVKSMLDEMLELSSDNSSQLKEMFTQLKQELIPHMKAEETAFYPILVKNSATKEDALEALEEHHAAEMVLNELDKMSKQDESWHAKLSVFKEMLDHHIEEEEGKIFDDAEEVISEEQIHRVMTNFQKEKERIKTQVPVGSQSK